MSIGVCSARNFSSGLGGSALLRGRKDLEQGKNAHLSAVSEAPGPCLLLSKPFLTYLNDDEPLPKHSTG